MISFTILIPSYNYLFMSKKKKKCTELCSINRLTDLSYLFIMLLNKGYIISHFFVDLFQNVIYNELCVSHEHCFRDNVGLAIYI